MKKRILFLVIAILLLTSACNYEKKSEKNTAEKVEEKEPVISCEDTDGGYEPGKKGIVTRYIDDEKTTSEDACKTEFKLVEIYCDDSQIKTKEIDCSHGCREGRCLTEAEADELEAKEQLQDQLDEQLQQQYDKEKLEKELEETKRLEDEQREKELAELQNEFYNCFNGFKDSFETDVDCGGLCAQGCGFGRACKETSDCAEGLVCNVRSKTCSTLRH